MTKPIARGKTEPLIVALLDRLPKPGEPWPANMRILWLRMFAGAFDVVYGPQLPINIGLPPLLAVESSGRVVPVATAADEPVAPARNGQRAPHVAAGCDFYVDNDGYVRCDHSDLDGVPAPTPERRVLAAEVGDAPIYEYRGARRDRATVIWADDTHGAAPGMNFCGPG